MYKNYTNNICWPNWQLPKILLIMKLTMVLLIVTIMQVSATGFAQKITLRQNDISLEQLFKVIRKQTGYNVLWVGIEVGNFKKIDANFNKMPLNDVLKKSFENQSLAYEIENRTIIVTKTQKALIDNNQDAYSAIDIRGRVVDAEGKPLPGASVKVKSTGKVIITDSDGGFQLKGIDEGAILEISFIGYVSVEIKANKDLGNIELKQSDSKLDEIVVVGYGTQKKVNLTGAVSTVNITEMTKRPVVNAATMLQGLVPGLSVVQNSGQPGQGNVSIQIRGKGTFSSAGSNPLILIDGVAGSLESLDPNTIESISVLKDAASASIYGSRGANGVILVTTKSGKNADGKIHVNYNANYGVHTPTRLLDLVTNSADYMRAWNIRIKNRNYGVDVPDRMYPQAEIDKYENATDRNLYPNFDWQDFIVNSAPTFIQNLSISGGKQTHYNLSLGTANEKGTMEAFNYKRYNGQLNVVSNISEKLKIGSIIQLKNGATIADQQGQTNYYLVTLAQPPTLKPTLPDGSGRYSWRAYPFEENNWNPYEQLKEHGATTDDYGLVSQIWSDFEVVKDLHWYIKGAANYSTSQYTAFSGNSDFLRLYRDPSVLGYQYITLLNKTNTQDLYTNVYTYLTYDKKIGLHNFNVMAGYSNEQDKYNFINGYRNNYSSPSTPELNAGAANSQTNSGSSNSWSMESGFGRFSYNFNGKYLFEANLRYDGTSRLSPDTRWGAFPSLSAGWRLSEESFMESTKSWLSNAKFRGSWGKLGNQNIGLYPYQTMLSYTGVYPFDNANLSQGVAQTALNNRNITWETTTTSDIGLDVTLFNKLSFSLGLYKKVTTDILRSAQVTGVVGLGAPTVNSGAMENKGFDFDMNYRDVVKSGAFKDLNFSASLILSAYKNKVVKFGARQDNGNTIYEEGRPWNTFYLLQVEGIFQSASEVASSPKQFGENTQPGMLKYKDINGDKKIDNNDRIALEKGVYPGLSYGFNFSADWKGFDLYGFFQGVAGSKVYVTGWGMQPFIQGVPPTKSQNAEAWTPQNHSTTTVMLGDPLSFNHPSTYFLKDNSYLRLKTLQIGYSLPGKWVNKLKISKVRLYFAGDNLFTVTKYPGLDPERGGNGSLVNYPQNKVISFGCNVNF